MIWKPSPNFSPGRAGYRPDVIVIHVMEGTLEGTDSWFGSTRSKVSAHYGIGSDGEEHQYVREENQAWHAGRVLNPTAKLVLARPGVNPNRYTIGIEHEGTATSVWPDAMYAKSAARVRDITDRWGFPIDRDHVIGHHEIYSKKTCPGAGDVDRIVRMAGGVVAALPRPTLRLGSGGKNAEPRIRDAVRELQTRIGLPMHHRTGFYGPITEGAVRVFQRRQGLLVDGIAGPNTWNALT